MIPPSPKRENSLNTKQTQELVVSLGTRIEGTVLFVKRKPMLCMLWYTRFGNTGKQITGRIEKSKLLAFALVCAVESMTPLITIRKWSASVNKVDRYIQKASSSARLFHLSLENMLEYEHYGIYRKRFR
jgi:hypothetical protein